jgi:hypothetical protein
MVNGELNVVMNSLVGEEMEEFETKELIRQKN